MFLFSLWGGWIALRRKLPTSRAFLFIATWAVPIPFIMNTAGWFLTENGRQPWIVQGLMKTADGASTSVSATDLIISLVAFFLVYVVLAVLDLVLMLRYGRRDLEPIDEDADHDARSDTPALTY